MDSDAGSGRLNFPAWRRRRRFALEALAITRHVAIMFRQRLAEKMAASIVRHEIHVICFRRRNCRAQRRFAWIRNRSRRKSCDADMYCTANLSPGLRDARWDSDRPARARRVLHRRIALQRIIFAQAVVENARHQWALGRERSFALDQRRHGNDLLRGGPCGICIGRDSGSPRRRGNVCTILSAISCEVAWRVNS